MNKTTTWKVPGTIAITALIAVSLVLASRIPSAVVKNCRTLTLGMKKAEVLTAMARFKPKELGWGSDAVQARIHRQRTKIRFEHQHFIFSNRPSYAIVDNVEDMTIAISCGSDPLKFHTTTGSGETYPPPPNHSAERPAAQ